MRFNKLTIADSEKLIFGSAPNPVRTRRGLEIGGGQVYAELNFTVPEGTVINRETLPKLKRSYREAVEGALDRAVRLEAAGLVIEFETLLEMTVDPGIGVELVETMNEVCERFYQQHGFKSEIRLTPNDTRDFDRPPLVRSGSYLDNMLELFEKGALAGGDLLSIESTGGKEVCDDALMNCDIRRVVFALSVLGVRDMQFLWEKIVAIAGKLDKIPAGDTACGFGNTAMVLAEKQYIPRIFAAIVRITSVVRSLVAVEQGAIGPFKDCAYEGVFIKAIAGIPIAMEGKTAACAHLSPVGNVAAACADLWSNESIQNIKLLSAMSPIVYLEQLEYDVRLMNTATREGGARKLQDWLVKSDICHDPQALILAPENVVPIAEAIVGGKNHIDASVRGALKGLEIIEESINSGKLTSSDRENVWIETIRNDLLTIPSDENEFVAMIQPELDSSQVKLEEYGL